MATAAKEMLAAMWPIACMKAGPKMVPNSCLLMGCRTGDKHNGIDDSSRSKRAQAVRQVGTATTTESRHRQVLVVLVVAVASTPMQLARGWGVGPASLI